MICFSGAQTGRVGGWVCRRWGRMKQGGGAAGTAFQGRFHRPSTDTRQRPAALSTHTLTSGVGEGRAGVACLGKHGDCGRGGPLEHDATLLHKTRRRGRRRVGREAYGHSCSTSDQPPPPPPSPSSGPPLLLPAAHRCAPGPAAPNPVALQASSSSSSTTTSLERPSPRHPSDLQQQQVVEESEDLGRGLVDGAQDGAAPGVGELAQQAAQAQRCGCGAGQGCGGGMW